MKHARNDYNRIQDPENLIPEDEPVFLLRSTDRFAAKVVLHYADLIAADPLAPTESRELSQRARDWAYQMRDYADKHRAKYPDLPPGA